ncbi:DNA primase [Synechococcus elongatus PCC 6301]|uniref:DNA primase n=1 Tax=Synechococcus sp. (strain ATCC 27144 / PCC 6301 / SAUG 1402/1) TaxID=269084 RepID=A0A0H3JZG3_SYNP6|nr:DNA primase [Synechococcus elongatus]BAD78451.1 DNA primase [Synechococcus elongatus PCC 6301]
MDTPRLHPETIAAVKERADIVDIVSEQVVLKKRGKDFVGLCPFHDDKSPSFTVSPAKQFYYCFSCGAGGNPIKFLMELGKQSFSEVVLDLAKRYQVPVRTLEVQQHQELQRQLSRRERLYEVLAVATQFYEQSLRRPEGAAALDYLRRSRQLQESTIQKFQLGYAPAQWASLATHLIEQKRFPADLVEEAGLVVARRNGQGYYDRFRDRLMIPIHDLQGRVVGFGGRTLTGEEPKYLNSPETTLFEKGKLLFGLDKARAAIAKQDQAVVVEGYFDVIALHAAGIDHAVASLGTALSRQQVKLLSRYSESNQIVLNFDADRAGAKAAERAIGEVEDLAYQGQVQLRVLNLPGGKDADEYLQRHSVADYRELLARSPLWLDWQIDQLLRDRNLDQADQFQAVVQAIVQLLGKLPNTPLRTHYVHQVAERLSQGEARTAVQLASDLRAQVRGQRWHGQASRWEKPGDDSIREQAEAQILKVYLHCPRLRLAVRKTLHDREIQGFSLQPHRLLWQAIAEIEEAHLGFAAMYQVERGEGNGDDLAAIDLVPILRDRLDQLTGVSLGGFLELSENDHADLTHPLPLLRGAVALVERLRCEKRCRHLLDSWARQSIHTFEHCIEQLLQAGIGEDVDAEAQITALHEQLNQEALHFQKLYYNERRYLQQLDQERCLNPQAFLGMTEHDATAIAPTTPQPISA